MNDLFSLLVCPECNAPQPQPRGDGVACDACGRVYLVRHGIPAMVRADSVLSSTLTKATTAGSAWNTDSDRQRQYWEAESSHRAVAHPIVAGFARQRWAHLHSRLPIDEIETALDVGAGSGFSTAYAPQHWRITASDGSWNMLRQNPASQRVLADATRLPFRDAAFDVAFCWELLHHIDEPWRALAEMRRVSRRFVFFFEPNPLNPAQAGFALADTEHRWVFRFTPRYLKRQAALAGLRIVDYQRVGLIFPNKTPAWLFALLRRAPFRIPGIGISQLVIAEPA